MEVESSLDELLLQYPGLTAIENCNKAIVVKGVVKVKNIWYRLNICCPQFPLLTNFELHVQKIHRYETYNSASKIEKSFADWTIYDLINKLPEIIDQGPNNIREVSIPNSPTNIYAEIVKLHSPHSYHIEVNEACTRIKFSQFAQNEQHFLDVELPSLALLDHSLPSCIPWHKVLFKSAQTLTTLLAQFQRCLEDLRPFYENFIDIDELCYVVQPILPTTKHNWRLFLLRDRIFLKLQIADPFATIASMSLHIIGQTQEVEQLRRTFSEGMTKWDPELDIHKNFLRIFDLCFFPMPPSLGGESLEQQQYCNICYSYRLDEGEIPIVSCDNVHCSLIFHAACLKEWFDSLTDGKTFIDVSFGTCPFCKAKMSMSFVELLKN